MTWPSTLSLRMQAPPLLVPGNPRGVPLRLAQEPETRRTRASFPPGPLRRHRGHEVLTLSLLALLLSQTHLHPPLHPSKMRWQRRSHAQTPGQLGCPRPPPAFPPLLPPSPRSLGSAAPPLPPLHLRPRSVPPSTTHRRTGVRGWSGSARSTQTATRAVQFRPSSRHWTSARQLPLPAPPPLPLPSFPPSPPSSPPPLPQLFRRPLVGRRRSSANPQPRGLSPSFSTGPPSAACLTYLKIRCRRHIATNPPQPPHWLRMVAPRYRLYREDLCTPFSIIYLLRTLATVVSFPPPTSRTPTPAACQDCCLGTSS